MQPSFHDAEDMLHFCPNRGFLTFSASELPSCPGRLLFDLRRAAIDLVTNGLAGVVFDHGILLLVGTEISAVPVHDAFFSSQQFRKHCDVMNIGGCHLDSVNQATVLVHANMSLVAKVPCIVLLRLVCFRVSLPVLVLRGRRRRDDGGIYNFTCLITLTFLCGVSLAFRGNCVLKCTFCGIPRLF